MRRKVFLFIIMMLIGFVVFPNGSMALTSNSPSFGNAQEISSYYFIHYNGEEQKIVINENASLVLTGWADESKSTVNGKLEFLTDSSNQSENITLDVNDNLKELSVPENGSIHYRLVVSDSFEVAEVSPQDLKSQITVIAKNDNGTSIEEVKTIDEYGTVINQVLTYYSTDENNNKRTITKEDYDSLNSVVDSSISVQSSSNSSFVRTQLAGEIPTIRYTTHIQDYGWLNDVSNGEMSGTTGQAKRMEAIKISIPNGQNLGVKYSAHVQDYGWLNYVSDGEVGGITGQSKRMEAIKIELTGANAANYDIYYRVHAQDYGWLDWAKNGEAAGTQGLTKRLETIEIVLVGKGGNAPGSTDKPFIRKPVSLAYSTHVQDYGWMAFVENGAMSGTQGQAKRLEAIKINLQDAQYQGNIIYSTHVQDYGWLNNVSNGQVSGITGQSKRMEAIKIELTGEMANYYDVYYRVHIQDYGWLGWAKNGMKAGSEGRTKRLEAINIKLVPKGQGEAVSETEAFLQPVPFIVFLDPGHGGYEPGAVAGGYREADLNLAVAKKVQSLLINRGYTVYMSRNGDTSVGLLDRSKMANDLHADIFVSIHTNATGSTTTTASGIESYFYESDPNHPSKINTGMATNPVRIAKSMTLADLIHRKMIAFTSAANRGTDGADFSVVRESAMPATLLEIGFINNVSERQKLFTDSYQNLLAKGIADGIDGYYRMY